MRETLYGRQAVRECLRAGRRKVYRLFLAQGTKQGGVVAEIEAAARGQGATVQEVERRRLDEISGGANHQGVAAEADPYPYADLDALLGGAERGDESPFLLLLDCLQDPQNLGTLLRTAEVVGVHGVVIPERRAASITPAVVNASAGAVEHLRVVRVTNLVRAIERLKKSGVWVVGLEDVPTAQVYDAVDLDMPLALVVGSEGQGLRRLVRERCDLLVRLPMRGQIESLNAAVAGSIALYAAWRQRAGRDSESPRSI